MWKRLDRMLVNDKWLELWPGTHYISLNPRTSDHSPLLLKGELQNSPVMLFRFDNYLASSLDFIPVLHSIWHNQVVGTSRYSMTRKLKALKPLFRQQRKKKGNDFSQNVKQAKGHTITNSDEVVEFIAFYEQLLGGTRNSRILDLTQYRLWASRILSYEDGVKLTRPVSVEEIKLDLFDIAEDKSPGSNGYMGTFYKVVWPVVGGEITRAIIDFFTNGRLLKQDLFTSYNQQNLPKRCALNVDLRKAYDTIEWDFLSTTMRLFGFPEVFIQWVEECVTTPIFSLCINDSAHGFFKGARVLRLGDPMSPYLFVLVIEVLRMILQQMIEQETAFIYHWRCTELSLFQLGFADDLSLFCEAHDPSIIVFQRGLELFATLSRLHVNLAKSH
ncbi:UNVERIFIED_CONTAM: Retrovirus-related Pol polyprotein from type-2 retrotransposable element R2DM [Sesamum radiatum]|uniref:Retrovirus-related Pol polyprotein from type-2 retrotransposable element R2DM n=1 Tax=Sesamum radiatum TaxID=300843 RepID=A0AAW2KUH9_SESRA